MSEPCHHSCKSPALFSTKEGGFRWAKCLCSCWDPLLYTFAQSWQPCVQGFARSLHCHRPAFLHTCFRHHCHLCLFFFPSQAIETENMACDGAECCCCCLNPLQVRSAMQGWANLWRGETWQKWWCGWARLEDQGYSGWVYGSLPSPFPMNPLGNRGAESEGHRTSPSDVPSCSRYSSSLPLSLQEAQENIRNLLGLTLLMKWDSSDRVWGKLVALHFLLRKTSA